jgi:hypothetical protein
VSILLSRTPTGRRVRRVAAAAKRAGCAAFPVKPQAGSTSGRAAGDHEGAPANIGYNGDVPRTGLTFKSNIARRKPCDAVDVAARYFVYKLFAATDHRPMAWHVLRGMEEEPATVARAVQRGWVVVRPHNSGRLKGQSGCLTDEGRLLALKGLRG